MRSVRRRPAVAMHPAIAKRQLCRTFGFEPSWYVDGNRCFLSTKDMDAAVSMCRLAAEGLERWPSRSVDIASCPVVPGHCFWAPRQSPVTAPCSLPTYCQLGAASARLGRVDVQLWTYGRVDGVPDNVTVHDASTLIPANVANDLLEQGLRIQHLSDMIRFLACCSSRFCQEKRDRYSGLGFSQQFYVAFRYLVPICALGRGRFRWPRKWQEYSNLSPSHGELRFS